MAPRFPFPIPCQQLFHGSTQSVSLSTNLKSLFSLTFSIRFPSHQLPMPKITSLLLIFYAGSRPLSLLSQFNFFLNIRLFLKKNSTLSSKKNIHNVFVLFCKITSTSTVTINLQIITLPHVSTLSCHLQTAHIHYLTKLHKYFNCSCW